jgi:glucan endo-1,3-alpha-glucosidase
MSLLPFMLRCSGPLLQQYIRDYINHPAAGRFGGKSILTTFAGESCSFGQGSTNNGWNTIMGQYRNQIYFAPAYNVDPQSLPNYDINAEVSWGSAWPVAGKEIETSRDTWFMQQLRGKGYIGTVSPAFAAHLPGKVGPTHGRELTTELDLAR